MRALLECILGRLPIGWLQLAHNRTRLAAAVAGVSFANILVLMQLGFLGALIGSIRLPYDRLNADILITASDMNTLADGSPLPRQRMFEALAIKGVAQATPLYYGRIDWKQSDGTVRTLDAFGVDPSGRPFRNREIEARLVDVANSDMALIDARTRNAPAGLLETITAGQPYTFEVKGRTLTVVGTFAIGGGFSADGHMVVSDQTFLKLFPQRISGAPNLILIRLEPSADHQRVLAELRLVLPESDSAVRTIDETVARDQRFQTTQKPVGLIFGFGVLIGILVGVIIVYQVLSTDVADHIKEYATFKAIGYPRRFFLSIVFEEAAVLAVFGFIPGIVIATGLYLAIAQATGLPMVMTLGRAGFVLFGTIAMCALSGALATRKLARANPADLF